MNTTGTVLDKIAEDVRKRLSERQASRDVIELREAALNGRYPNSLRSALEKSTPQIIAEVKTHSPSEGAIAPEVNPVAVANEYVANGAAAISVLTEKDHFGGDLNRLVRIRAAQPDAILLMKDFVIDQEQLFEARMYGADAVLLIVALLGEQRSRDLFNASQKLGLSTLVEVHNEEEMQIAERIGADVIGVNNRDLKTLQVSLDVSRRLASAAPKGALLVAESGIRNALDIRSLVDAGYSAFLIGTSFMKTKTPGLALSGLLKELR